MVPCVVSGISDVQDDKKICLCNRKCNDCHGVKEKKQCNLEAIHLALLQAAGLVEMYVDECKVDLFYTPIFIEQAIDAVVHSLTLLESENKSFV
jgi:hypothetical protein